MHLLAMRPHLTALYSQLEESFTRISWACATSPGHLQLPTRRPAFGTNCVLARHEHWPHEQRARLVEELHADKGVEDKRVVLRGAIRQAGGGHAKDARAAEHQRPHDRQLERALAHHRLQHLGAAQRAAITHPGHEIARVKELCMVHGWLGDGYLDPQTCHAEEG